MLGWLNAYLKRMETGWVFNYPVPAIQIKVCRDACQCLMLHPYITAPRTSRQNFSGQDPAKGVFSFMHSYNVSFLLFTKYLTNTNMPTALQKNGT